MGMMVEYDTEAGAFYVRASDAPQARTVTISDDVMVDVAADGTMVGLELLCPPGELAAEDRDALIAQFPLAAEALAAVEHLTRLAG